MAVAPLEWVAVVVPSAPLVMSPRTVPELVLYEMCSLSTLIVPLAGIPEESARLIVVSTIATAALVVVEAVSKSEAEVRSSDVTLAFMPPSKVV